MRFLNPSAPPPPPVLPPPPAGLRRASFDTWLAIHTQPWNVVAIDGNIGSGKSTLVRNLRAKLEQRGRAVAELPSPGLGGGETSPAFMCATERTHEWKRILPLYYKDTARWAFPFQMQCLLSHIRTMREAEATGARLLITERSPMATQHVFGSLLQKEGLITPEETELFEGYVEELAWRPDHVLFLECPAEECERRILARSRDGEGGIPLAYLQSVDAAYSEFLADYEAQGFGVHRLSTFTATEEEVLAQVLQKLEVIGDGGAAPTKAAGRDPLGLSPSR